MLERFLSSLGIGDELIVNIDKVRLDFQSWPLLCLGLILLGPIAYFVYRRQTRNLGSAPAPLRNALTVTRVIIYLLMVFVLAGPYLKIDHDVEQKPIVALMFDQSQSMSLPAGPFGADALKAAQALGLPTQNNGIDFDTRKTLDGISRAKFSQQVVWNAREKVTVPLADKFELRQYVFSREPTLVRAEPNTPYSEPPTPGGSATALGDCIAKVAEDAAGQTIAGVLVFSDGQSTGGQAPLEVARALRELNAPVFTVPAGVEGRVRDLSLVDVFTSGLVSVGDTAKVAVTLESTGFDKRPVKIVLMDGDTVLDTKEITLRTTEQQQVELSFEAKAAGMRYLTVKVDPFPEEPESLRANNSDLAALRVSDEKIRVLFIEGTARWDFRFLKNSMRRDHGLAGASGDRPDIVLESEARRLGPAMAASQLPATLEDFSKYHVVILGDVSTELLSTPFVKTLAEAVREKGLGLVVAAGPNHMPHRHGDDLKELLPVRMKEKSAGFEAPVYGPFRLELTSFGALNECLRLYDDVGRNQNVWSKMPPFYWSAGVERATPSAQVLCWNASVQGPYGKAPLIASHFVGQGKVVFVGTDSTWLWRQNVGDRYFYKFWGQTIRFVARRDEKNAKKSWMEIRPVRVQPGDSAEVELMAFDAEGAPRVERQLTVQTAGPNGAKPVTLLADPVVKGRFTGKFQPTAVGDYRITYEPGAGENVVGRLVAKLAPEELRYPNIDRPLLQSLGSLSGGMMFEYHELEKVVEKLTGQPKRYRLHRESTIWDNWLTLLLVVVVYCLDVGLRRLAGLS